LETTNTTDKQQEAAFNRTQNISEDGLTRNVCKERKKEDPWLGFMHEAASALKQ